MNSWSKFLLYIFVILLLFSIIRGCSAQSMTKNLGGSMEVELEPNQKLQEVTWKDDSLWFLTKNMQENDTAEIYHFYEKDSLGILEGEVVIKEIRLTKEELKEREEQKQLEEDFFKDGNIEIDNDLKERFIFIEYDEETGKYKKIKEYKIDENFRLIEIER